MLEETEFDLCGSYILGFDQYLPVWSVCQALAPADNKVFDHILDRKEMSNRILTQFLD